MCQLQFYWILYLYLAVVPLASEDIFTNYIKLCFFFTAKTRTTTQKKTIRTTTTKTKVHLDTTTKYKAIATTKNNLQMETGKSSLPKSTSPKYSTEYTTITNKNTAYVPNFEKTNASSSGKIVGLVVGMISLIFVTVFVYKWKVRRENNTFQPLTQVCF